MFFARKPGVNDGPCGAPGTQFEVFQDQVWTWIRLDLQGEAFRMLGSVMCRPNSSSRHPPFAVFRCSKNNKINRAKAFKGEGFQARSAKLVYNVSDSADLF